MYLERGAPAVDSTRMRVRFSHSAADFEIPSIIPATTIARELGCQPRYVETSELGWKYLFAEGELRDILDVHVIIVSELRLKGLGGLVERWWRSVSRIFREENLCYTINQDGEVHFAQDAEFQSNMISALASLEGARYRGALDHFVSSQKALDVVPPRTREAIRQTFEAVETVFKLAFPDETLLGASEVEKKLKPVVLAQHDGTERDALNGLLNGFKQWVISCQGYRHGKGSEGPDNPSISTAVLSVSNGASYLRWLAEFDDLRQSAKNQTEPDA